MWQNRAINSATRGLQRRMHCGGSPGCPGENHLPTCSRRSVGFTLVEMLLVLAVLAVFAAMTVPSVLHIYGQRQLTESAERVRAVAASARVRAIESGLIYQFCCEANGRHFVVVPFEADHMSTGQNGQQGSGSGGPNSAVTVSSRVWGQLPKGLVFSSVIVGNLTNANPTATPTATASTGSHKIAQSSLEGLPNAGDLANLSWAQPIYYNLDGSASTDAQIVISDSKSQQITMSIRGFTGAVSMSRLVAGKHK